MRGPDMKATAVAHPIQGLIKYHGLADPVLRLPFHDSISVCTARAPAAAHAAGLRLAPEEISRFARRGAGSASRSVTGGFSKWKMGLTDEDSYAVQLAGVDLQMAMIVALVPAFKQTDDAHR